VTLRVALLGYGWVATMHTEAARACGTDVVDVVGVAGHRGDRARAFAERFAIPVATDDWRSLVTDDRVDAVVIGTPNSLHHDQAVAALAAGKHVLVDKPLATTVADGARIIEAARRADRVLGVGHMWRHRDEVLDLRHSIVNGQLGRIIRTHGHGVHASWGPSGWFTDPTLAGGGALIDMGIHAVDTARFLLGDPQPTRVQASIGIGAYGDYEVDDDGLLIIDWETGTRSLVEFGWWQPRLAGLEAETEVLGTAGHGRIWNIPMPPPADYVHCTVPMYAAQLADFARCCATGATPISSADAGLVALEIVEAAYRAAGIDRAGPSA
jgi:predicted dehydrogenase